MFTDLVKARKGGAMSKREQEEEVSPERIRELMDELFSGSDADDDEGEMDKGGMYGSASHYKNSRLHKMDDEDELEDDFDDEDEMDKGYMSQRRLEKADEEDDERREMMDKVYSMIDDLSDEELTRIIESRTMKKALAMNVIKDMSTQALSEFCSQMEANGEQGMSSLEKGEGEDELDMMDKGEMELDLFDDEDEMEKGRGESCDF